jgi:hypothetical protein
VTLTVLRTALGLRMTLASRQVTVRFVAWSAVTATREEALTSAAVSTGLP